jgi:hypothetical protein
MAALTKLRNTPAYSEPAPFPIEVELKANAIVFKGGIVVRDASGYGVAGLTGTGLTVVGVCDPQISATDKVDNTGGANGAKTVRCMCGVFRFNNSTAGDLIGITEVGKRVYLVDDQTVAKTSNSSARSPAGIVEAVDSAGVWVRIDATTAAMLPA